jgi:hypothetical protein
MKKNIIQFLENRGFTLDQVDEGLEIRIGRRSLPGGLNEIFVATDELEAIGRLGRMETIVCEKEALVLKLAKK